jgi:hypothetical protein
MELQWTCYYMDRTLETGLLRPFDRSDHRSTAMVMARSELGNLVGTLKSALSCTFDPVAANLCS